MKAAALVLTTALLTACATATPPPQENFYRLGDPTPTQQETHLDGSLRVGLLRAGGLYADRPMLYSDDAHGLRLRQYHYHQWVESPPALLADYMAAWLSAAQVATHVIGPEGPAGDYELEGRVVRMERRMQGTAISVRLELALELVQRGQLMMSGNYGSEVVVADAMLETSVRGYQQALDEILARFSEDLAEIQGR